MKALYALLIILLLSINKTEKCQGSEPTQASSCHSRDKTGNEFRCCYVNQKYYLMGTLEKGKFCQAVTKSEFDNINDLVKSLKAGVEKMGGIFEIFEIDCSSNYLYISLLSLIIFLL